MSTLEHVSFELFPPATADAAERLDRVCERLATVDPEYFSVTYGAGGSTRDRTLETVRRIHATGRTVAPHLSIGVGAEQETRDLIETYREEGIHRVVALRGDLPSGMGNSARHHAIDLVHMLREIAGDHFTIAVAGYPEVHPEAASADTDLQHFVDKVRAGANEALTQYFYNAAAYFDFVNRAQQLGVTVPIIPGVMPITNHDGILRFSDKCGADIPRWIRKRLHQYRDEPESLRAFGLDVVTHLCRELLDGGAPGLHFYAMNQSKAPLEILRRLGLPDA